MRVIIDLSVWCFYLLTRSSLARDLKKKTHFIDLLMSGLLCAAHNNDINNDNRSHRRRAVSGGGVLSASDNSVIVSLSF